MIRAGLKSDSPRISTADCATTVVQRPFAVYKKTWPCRRTWERAGIDCMTTGLEQLHTEVFRGPSLEKVVERGDRFFSVMPSVRVVSEADDEQVPTDR